MVRIVRGTLLRAGADVMLRQIFVHGLFHADPHPGNVLFLAGTRTCFLDFGMFGRLGRRERRRMAFVFWALVEGDYEGVADQLLRLSARRPGADAAGFRAAVEEWFGEQASDYSIARLLLRQLALGAAHGVVFPRELMLLARSLVNLEATAMVVDPALHLAELARPLLPELRRSLLLDREALEEAWRENRFEYLGLALELPDLLPELADRLRGGRDGSAAEPPPVPRSPWAAALIGGFAAGLVAAQLTRRRA